MDIFSLLPIGSQQAPQTKKYTVEGIGTKAQYQWQISEQKSYQYSPTITKHAAFEQFTYTYAPAPTYSVIINSPHSGITTKKEQSISHLPQQTYSPSASQTPQLIPSVSASSQESGKDLLVFVTILAIGGVALWMLVK